MAVGLFEEIKAAAEVRRCSFLVIGGLAVNFHGFSRDTADLDLLIRSIDRGAWLEIMAGFGYTVYQERTSFLQLTPPAQGAWPVDLMLVKDPTFDPMLAASLEVEMYGARLRIPSLDHLLALKLHALKHGHIERFTKDLLDVEALVRVNAVDLRSEKMRQLFLKYGTVKIYEQISSLVTGDQRGT